MPRVWVAAGIRSARPGGKLGVALKLFERKTGESGGLIDHAKDLSGKDEILEHLDSEEADGGLDGRYFQRQTEKRRIDELKNLRGDGDVLFDHGDEFVEANFGILELGAKREIGARKNGQVFHGSNEVREHAIAENHRWVRGALHGNADHVRIARPQQELMATRTARRAGVISF